MSSPSRPEPRDHLAPGGNTRYVNPDELLDERRLAEEFSLSVKTLQRWRWQREGPPYVKVGSLVRYRRADFDDWLRSRTVGR